MQFSQGRGLSAFFYSVAMRIICIIRVNYVKCRGRVRGGVLYWRGWVIGGGIEQQGRAGLHVEQGGGTNRGAVGEPAAGACLVVCLPADVESRSAARRGGVADFQQVKKVLHGAGLPVHRARRRVVVSPSWARFSLPTCLRQRVVDGAEKGQSVFFMPL